MQTPHPLCGRVPYLPHQYLAAVCAAVGKHDATLSMSLPLDKLAFIALILHYELAMQACLVTATAAIREVTPFSTVALTAKLYNTAQPAK